MNKLFAYLILIVPFTSAAQYDTIFHANKINVLTVSIDYQFYTFTSASMNYYDCSSCSNNSIPYEIDYEEPADFGSMTFKLNPSSDTIFHGGIVWMGQGQISYPLLSLNNSAPFDNIASPLPVPTQISYLGIQGNSIPADSETNLAWQAVSMLRIVHLFANDNYDVLCYLYAPTVGMFDPGPAKWIFFFYKNGYPQGPVGINENSNQEISIYPNPASEKLLFNSKLHLQSYTISDLTGKAIASDKLDESNEIYIEHLPSGVYFIEFESEQGETQKLKWIKE